MMQHKLHFLLVSVSDVRELISTAAALKTIQSEYSTCNTVSTRIIVEMKQGSKHTSELTERSIVGSAQQRKNYKDNRICYRCGKRGHIARFC